MASPLIGLIMGSQSDWATLKAASAILDALAIPHETRIVSAHRTPDRLVAFIRQQGSAARVRPDMKVVFFDDWERPEDRLKGTAAILRKLTSIAERAKAA